MIDNVNDRPSAPVFALSAWHHGWHVVPYEVPWRDLDAAGHVNNAVFLTWFEWGRTKYWVDLTGGQGHEAIDFIVARAEINFRQQVSMLEKVEICTRIGEIRNSSFDFLCEIRKSDGRTLAADGKVVVVHFDWKSNASKPVSKELRERIAKFQEV
jgi:acyl-CoA thioester hydrolase